MDEKIPVETSQQKAGEHSLAEGYHATQGLSNYDGSSQAIPGPVTEPIKGEVFQLQNPFTTTQQERGEYSDPAKGK